MTHNDSSIVSDKDAANEVDGLRAGEYYIFETKAPAGYVKLDVPVRFTVSRAGIVIGNEEVNAAVDEDDTLLLKIKNQSGYELPHTGGPGTILYTLGGLILMVSTLLYGFAMRRRRERRYE